MTILRRILSSVTLVAAAAGLASANSITYGFDASTGLNTVTQTGSISTLLGNVDSPASLFSFLSFNQLGLPGNYIYVGTDTTFDYQFQNVLTSFSIANNDSNTDNVTAGMNSLVTNDSLTTLPGYPSYSGFLRQADGATGLLIPNASNTFTANPAVGTKTTTLATISSVTLAPGASVSFAGLPITIQDGIGFNNCGSFGDVRPGSGCAANFSDLSGFFQSNNFTFGTTDDLVFFGNVNGSGNFNVTFQAVDQYSALAEVTYEYFVNTGTPEPTTMLLMGGALVGLGLFGKKRFKKS